MIWAWLGAALVGLSLGLLGSGGAILTVPILVYLVGHNEKSAIAESLAIVGAIALAGTLRAAMQRRVDFRSVLLLAPPGIVGAYTGAAAATFIPGAMQLILLALLMFVAAALMYRGRAPTPNPRPQPAARALTLGMMQGFGLGLATGLVGVGGGFLIVPVLVLLRKIPMSTAVGTSLAIIAVNSASGFLKYLSIAGAQVGPSAAETLHIDWNTVTVFAAIGIAGSLVGNALAGRFPQATLKRIFAVFLILMAVYILARQAPRVFPAHFDAKIQSIHLEPALPGPPPTV
jgi:uncharacterized protein